jgi:hypothetical protein
VPEADVLGVRAVQVEHVRVGVHRRVPVGGRDCGQHPAYAAGVRSAADTGTPADWQLIGDSLTDAVTGLLLAPRHSGQ